MNQKLSLKNKIKGQGLVEYSLVAGVVSLAVAGALIAFSPEVKSVASTLMKAVSGGISVGEEGVVIPGMSLTSTPTGSPASTTSPAPTATHTPTSSPTPTPSSTPTLSPTPTLSCTPTPMTPTPTWTPLVVVTPTPNTLACAPGTVSVSSKSSCAAIAASNNCENYTYQWRQGKCSWY